MICRLAALAGAVALVLIGARGVLADGDSAGAGQATVLVGEQFSLTLRIKAPSSANIQIDTVASSWNGIEVVGVDGTFLDADGAHRMELTAAGFRPGVDAFAPTVLIIDGARVEKRELPPVPLTVLSSLPDGAPLELSPLPGIAGTGGARSPLLVPAVAAGASVLSVLLGFSALLLWRSLVPRLRNPAEGLAEPLPTPPENPLGVAESLLEADPVGAYRLLGQTVRAELGRRYDLPAPALTTRELSVRMDGHGVDRWEARLVSGLLEECDSVVYAGYRPALERRQADLHMAREILGEAV